MFRKCLLAILMTVYSAGGNNMDLCPTNLPRDNDLQVYRSKCYRYNDRELNWPDAQSECRKEGGYLLEIPDTSTQDHIENELRNRFNGVDRFWLGLNDINKVGAWKWDNGDPLTYKNWDRGQPDTCSSCDEKCVKIRMAKGGKWHDYPCLSFYSRFVCEYHFRYCNRDPCSRGTCVDVVNGYTCVCDAGYTGNKCQTEIDECDADPCANGACLDIVNGFVCTCHPGYTGTQCNSEIDECQSSPCVHGTCTDLFNAFQCTCHSGFTGILCETEIDECASSPCIYGTCTDFVNYYTCSCFPGYKDVNCQTEIDECAVSPCDHGGCSDLVNNYTCTCYVGYDGNDCEKLDPAVQETYLSPPPNATVTCVDSVNFYGKINSQTLDCLEERRDSLMKIESVGGLIDDIMDTNVIQDFFRIRPNSINEACHKVRNTSVVISIIYHSEIPAGSQYHEFNLGLVSSEVKILQENFCPIVNDVDVLIDPAEVINNRTSNENTTYRYSDNSFGLVLVSFCVPLDDVCFAILSNDNKTIQIKINTVLKFINANDSTVSATYHDGRAYLLFNGILQAMVIDMECKLNNSMSGNETCTDNYGLVTSTPESKTLDKGNGGWNLNSNDRVLGMHSGKIMFRSEFFNTDGFNLFIIIPEPIRFGEIFANFDDKLLDSYVVLAVIVGLFVTLIFLTIITRYYDRLDAVRNRYYVVRDLELTDTAAYCIAIQTGFFSVKNFTDPLFIQLVGLYSTSEVKAVNFCCNEVINLKRCSTAYVILTTKRHLGPIQSLRLWLDTPGAKILIDKVRVQEIEDGHCYVFLLNEWLDMTQKRGTAFRSLNPANRELQEEHTLFSEFVKTRVIDDIISLSVVFRPRFDAFTRTRRLYSLAVALSLSMLTSALWYNNSKDIPIYGVTFGPISVNYKQVLTGIIGSVLSIPPLFLIVRCFQIQHNKSSVHPSDLFPRRGEQKCLRLVCVCTWIFVVSILCANAFIVFMYSLQWGGDLSNEWLLSIIFGLIADCALGPLKVVILSAVIVYAFKNDAVRDISLVPPLSIVFEKRESGNAPTSSWSDGINEGTKRTENELLLDRKLFNLCRNFVASVLYIAVLFLVASHDSISTSNEQNLHFLKELDSKYEVTSLPDLQVWLDTIFIPFVNNSNEELADINEDAMVSDGTSFVLGLMRLRQIRIRVANSCLELETYKLFATMCDNDREAEETRTFCTGWNSSHYCDVHPWFTYKFKEDSTSSASLGEYGSYHGGGFMIDLDNNLKTTNLATTVTEIRDSHWLDEKTQFFSVETTILNPSSNLFTILRFRWELRSFGPVLAFHAVKSANLYPYTRTFDFIILGFQLIFLVMTFLNLLSFSYGIWLFRAGRETNLAFLLEFLSVAFSLAAISFYIYRIDRTIYTVETMFNNKDRFHSFDNLAFLDELYRLCLGFHILLRILGLLKYITFNYHLHLMRTTILRSRDSLLSSIFLITIGILAFASLEYVHSGRTTYAYRSYLSSFFSLVTSTISMAKLSLNSASKDSRMNNVVFILFCLIVNFILINLLVSVLNETLAAVKNRNDSYHEVDSTYDRELNEHLMKKLRRIFLFGGSPRLQEKPSRQVTSHKDQFAIIRVSNFCKFVEKKYIRVPNAV